MLAVTNGPLLSRSACIYHMYEIFVQLEACGVRVIVSAAIMGNPLNLVGYTQLLASDLWGSTR